MKVKTDLHTHLSERESNNYSANQVLSLANQRLGNQGVFGVANSEWNGDYDFRYELFLAKCLQELGHNNVELIGNGNAFYSPKHQIYVIKAQEIEKPEGHLLVLGLPHGLNVKQKTLENCIQNSIDLNCPIQANHPFFFQGLGPHLREHLELLENLNGFEVHNGEAVYGNQKAKQFFRDLGQHYGLGSTSSSDAHSLSELGLSYTLLNQPNFQNDSEELNESLKKVIQEHKDYSEDKQVSNLRGTVVHATKLITRLALLKFGINLS